MVAEHVSLQHGRSHVEDCILLWVGCLGRANIAYLLLLIFFNKFYSSMVFHLMYLYCQLVCVFYLCKQKKIWEGYRFSCGILLNSADWLKYCLNDYFVSAIPMSNSIIRKPMWKPKFHKNLPKQEIFQIKVEL